MKTVIHLQHHIWFCVEFVRQIVPYIFRFYHCKAKYIIPTIIIGVRILLSSFDYL